jgi:hypothetical protein
MVSSPPQLDPIQTAARDVVLSRQKLLAENPQAAAGSRAPPSGRHHSRSLLRQVRRSMAIPPYGLLESACSELLLPTLARAIQEGTITRAPCGLLTLAPRP